MVSPELPWSDYVWTNTSGIRLLAMPDPAQRTCSAERPGLLSHRSIRCNPAASTAVPAGSSCHWKTT